MKFLCKLCWNYSSISRYCIELIDTSTAMKSVESITSVQVEEKERYEPQIISDTWDFSPDSLEEIEGNDHSPTVLLIGALVFILIVLGVILI